MLRMIGVVIYILVACSLFSQTQPNPFDLKYRPQRPAKTNSYPLPDTSVAKTPSSPPTEDPVKPIEPVIDSGSFKMNRDTQAGSNPFELDKSGKKEPEKISQGTSDIQFHSNSSINAPVSSPRHTSKGVQIFFILLSLLFLIFIVNVERNFVKDLWRVISNENYSSLHLRNQRNTMRQILLIMGYVIFFIQAGIFLWHVLAFFNYSGGFLDNIWICIGFVMGIYAVRHLVIRYLRWLFNNEKEMNLFGFDISTFNIMVGLVLLPVNVLLNFGPDSLANPLIIIGLIVMAAAYLMRQLRWMLTARRLIANSLFLFFVYLCAVEILPLWAVLKFIW